MYLHKVVQAFIAGDHPYEAVSDLVEATVLRRGDVVSAIAVLASDGRAERVINDVDGAIIVRWVLKRWRSPWPSAGRRVAPGNRRHGPVASDRPKQDLR